MNIFSISSLLLSMISMIFYVMRLSDLFEALDPSAFDFIMVAIFGCLTVVFGMFAGLLWDENL